MTSGHERASVFLEGEARNQRDILTPEGVPLPVVPADYADRASAFLIDFVFQIIVIVLLYLTLFFGLRLAFGLRLVFGLRLDPYSDVATAAVLFLAFLVRNLYFLHFELAWQGATPGKRIIGLRVVDRRGGPLLPAAVIARNLTRELECFLPLGLLLSLNSGAGAGRWDKVLLAAWVVSFAAVPFLNRDRMRCGDLIAGTMVISMPRRTLLRDLVEQSLHHAFTDRQLRAYGAFELQVLEELLRRPDAPDKARLLREVCDKICRRIGWPDPVPEADTVRFLTDFYTAERAFLEREQLFGKLHPDKHHGSGPAS